ncbi:MAG: YbaK/EbsC family protein [Patescibacteria group bacterium]
MAKKTKMSAKIVNYLKNVGVKHNVLEHKTVYTASDVATTMRLGLKDIAKTLLVLADKNYYIVLLSAACNLDFKKLIKVINKISDKPVKTIKIPAEKIMESLLKIKAGAMSAFGGAHKLPVIMDKKLAKLKKAIFSSGSFNHSIEMAVKDFIKIEKVILGDFSAKRIKKVNLKQSKAK